MTKNISDPIRLNHRLSKITFVTNLGDYLSLFAILLLGYQSTGSVLWAAQAVPMRSLGVALGGVSFPRMISIFSVRMLLIGSQLLSGALLFASILYWKLAAAPAPSVFLLLAVLQSMLKQYFDGAREVYSAELGRSIQNATQEGVERHQRGLTADLLHGFYGAQIIGPLLSLLLLKVFPAELSLLLDAVSFMAAGFLCLTLPDVKSPETHSFFRPFFYLHKQPSLLGLTLLRSIGFWVPAGIFNYMAFSVITEHYGLKLLDSVWVYAAAGVGLTIASIIFKTAPTDGHPWLINIRNWLKHTGDPKIAFLALLGLGLSRIPFLTFSTLSYALFFLMVSGVFTGMNAIASQSLRRNMASAQQLPEIIGLELLIARVTDVAVAKLCLVSVTNRLLSFQQAVWIALVGYVILAFLHLFLREMPADNTVR